MSDNCLSIDEGQLSPVFLCLESNYHAHSDVSSVGGVFVQSDTGNTESVLVLQPPESEIDPYDCCRSSEVLSFWDDPKEDVYTFEDGYPV